MPAKLKHLAIVSDQYTLLERFYEAMFGMKPSPDNPPAGSCRSQRWLCGLEYQSQERQGRTPSRIGSLWI